MVSTCPRIHLLLVNNHWLPITKLRRLYNNGRTGYFEMCDCCLGTYYNQERYEKHLPCQPKKYIQHEIMPTEPLVFKDFNKCVDLSDVVYADIEAILEKCTTAGKLQKHVPCCVGAYWVSKVGGAKYSEFKGQDCILNFVNYIEELATHIYERNKTETRVSALKKSDDLATHDAATACIWCKKDFIDDDSLRRKVFDHDHLTGKYRGAACQGCNNKLRQDRSSLVVVFHNFRGYDSHAVCIQGLANKPDWIITPIAQSSEKYMSVSARLRFFNDNGKSEYFKVKFIDSYQLLNCSLAVLAKNLATNGDYSLLKHTMKLKVQYPAITEDDIAGKGIFPYSYVNSWEKLQENQLPSFEDFYDELEEGIKITAEEYAIVNKHYCKASNPYVNLGAAHSKEEIYLGYID